MSRTDDRVEPKLPVTAEVGGEGGSYAEPTIQEATFGAGLERVEGHGGPGSAANYGIRSEEVTGAGVGAAPDPSSGMLRYPTENSPSAERAARPSPPKWRAGAIGAAAGFAAALIARGVSRRR